MNKYNYYQCSGGGNEEGVCAIIRARSLTRARRMFWTKTDAREIIRQSGNTEKFTYEQLSDYIAARFDAVKLNPIKQEYVLNTNYTPFTDILRDLGWTSEDNVKCEECDLSDMGVEGTYIEDDGIYYCPDCYDSPLSDQTVPTDKSLTSLCESLSEIEERYKDAFKRLADE